jgi:hypothetical protein
LDRNWKEIETCRIDAALAPEKSRRDLSIVNWASMLPFKIRDHLQIVNLLTLRKTTPRRRQRLYQDGAYPMPVVVIAVSMLVSLASMGPSEASQPCVSRTDARQHYGSVHIYRHGQDHCWDAVPARGNRQIHRVQRAIERPGPDDSVPEMLPDEARWIDIDRVTPPSIIERKPEPTDLPRGVVLVAIAIVVTLGTIEALFRGATSPADGAATGRNRGRP